MVPLEKGQFRHLSASEAALLNGLSPGLNFGSEPRLGLALVGQVSSPLQAAWVSNAAIHSLVLGGLVSMPTQTSTAILQAMREDLISEAVELGMFVQPEPVADTQMDSASLDSPTSNLEHHLLKPPVGPGPQVHIICPCSCLLGAFLDRMYLETGVIITQASRAGQLLARRDHLKAGEALELLATFEKIPQKPVLFAPPSSPDALVRLLSPSIPLGLRTHLLQLQKGWMADDQVAKALGNIAGKFSQVQVIDPVAATCAMQFQRHELLAPVNAKASHSGSFVTAVAVLGHWVSVHWRVDGPRVYACTSDPRPAMLQELDLLHFLFGKGFGFGVRAFRFFFGVARDVLPGQCGAVAMCDLLCHLRGEEPLPTSAATHVTCQLVHEGLERADWVRSPLFLAGAASSTMSLLVQGLAGILKDKGHARRQAGIQRL